MLTADFLKLEGEADKYVEKYLLKDRIDIRLPKFQKSIFEKVAVIQGVTLTDFILKAATDAAVNQIERSQKIVLSLEGQKAFIESLDNTREFSESIKNRYEKYSKLNKGLNSDVTRTRNSNK